jgi:hypothetical protein
MSVAYSIDSDQSHLENLGNHGRLAPSSVSRQPFLEVRMFDVSDYSLQKEETSAGYRESSSAGRLIVLAVLMTAAAGIAVWMFINRSTPTLQTTQSEPQTAPATTSRPLGAESSAIDLPPLAETDALVRTIVAAISTHPFVAKWLATDDLIRGFTVAVDNIASGATPARRFNTLRPAASFRAIGTGGSMRIDPQSYDRYRPLAAAFDSLDAMRVAQVYSMLKPRIEDAYAELGRGGSFDVPLERAIVVLLEVPRIPAAEAVVPKGIVFGFGDPTLERLTPAQKQLLRMGPENVSVVQAKLRQIAVELGIPSERLPT